MIEFLKKLFNSGSNSIRDGYKKPAPPDLELPEPTKVPNA